jgi:protein-export membrane protein SecD
MLIFYRLPGLVAGIALIIYTALVLGYLSLFNATLTLPGIAGFILSVGMAVDGNVIIFERLREEIRWGKTLNAALEAAFARAWVAIFDGNVTAIIAGVVLYFFGSGPVKGFAVTLIIGVVLSMFSSVFVTRNILELLMRTVRNEKLYL